ncbi:MAG: sensor histidine kinase [Hamadaea sp.]|uniref:sensor histidine kinase n=1 Tax=Hamadaea sp. TaxID=2024425 RepID=UPI0018215292|nr:histidine kinase [Hamadaea sp.]NUR72011.1 sensor histidine kinase [Hamadaea sp.]NUT22624.1 sensor histidine kinase [Hamadaea sp.]
MRQRWLTDVGLTVVVLLAQSAPYLFTQQPPDTIWVYWPVLLTSLPTLTRRWQPGASLAVAAVGIAAYAAVDAGPSQPIWYGPLVIFYTVAHQAGRIERILCVIGTAVGALSVIGSVNTAVRELATWSAAYAIGALGRTRKEMAAQAERNRIARDLHDILGHSLAVMIVQAEGGAAVARTDPGRAEAAFDAISASGREAMGQLRAAVGELRESQPQLADLHQLVRTTQRTGLSVRLTERGRPRPTPAEVQVAAYRVVQEALTNVVKHAGATSAEVLVDWTAGLRVSVSDDGRGAGTTAGGHGLTGLRERVGAVGGRISVGAGDQGKGFRVAAVFS